MQDVLDAFHPLVAGWFRERFGAPTEPQVAGWPRIGAGEDVLIAAPTERLSDRTSVLCLARGFDNVETRVEQVFETCVRTA